MLNLLEVHAFCPLQQNFTFLSLDLLFQFSSSDVEGSLQLYGEKYYSLFDILIFPFSMFMQIPVALLISQYQKDSDCSPGLLRFSEVVNLFNEFGHVVCLLRIHEAHFTYQCFIFIFMICIKIVQFNCLSLV